MRDEESKFAEECTGRDRYHHFINKVRSPTKSRPMEDNLAAIRGIRQVPGRWVENYPRRQDRVFKVNQAWPNVWSYHS